MSNNNNTARKLKKHLQMWTCNLIVKPYIMLFGSKDRRKLKYNVSLCLIFKDEAPFLKEWLDYHLTIGVDHFYLFNNNSTDNYLEVIQPYIDNHTVTLTQWPLEQSQSKCYRYCLETFRNETNWIGYIDADEFVCPKKYTNINSWIKKWRKYPAVKVDWLQFGTSGNIHHNYSQNVIEQYLACWDKFFLGKTFVNTRYQVTNWNTQAFHHLSTVKYSIFGIKFNLIAVNQFGFFCPLGVNRWNKSEYIANADMQINHYYIKAWDIYKEKMVKSDVYFEKNPKSIDKFIERECKCVKHDYTILRFLQLMRLREGILSSD